MVQYLQMTEGEKTDEEIQALMNLAVKRGLPADVAVNPFITNEERRNILDGKIQDPEWD